MNRIDQVFAELKQRNGTALIPYLTIGDPDVATSVEIIEQLELAGAHMVELGVPYSDPLADGPVIQRASQRALQHQITIVDCIKAAKQARERGVKLPFILFTYYNPALQLGLKNFFQFLQEHDISGVIIPDLPMEENDEAMALSVQYNIHLIPLVAPTSNARVSIIASQAAGFVYCVSSLGVTGMRSRFFDGIESFISTVKASTDLPVAVGFGISTREHVEQFSKLCDGVVVGSAIVKKIEDVLPLLTSEATRQNGLLQIREFVGELNK